jgi:hypothetical protein
MAWAAYNDRQVHRYDLADHNPVEQVTQRRQTQLSGRRESRLLRQLEVGRDMHVPECRKLRHDTRLKPFEEFLREARKGAARVRIADVGGE